MADAAGSGEDVVSGINFGAKGITMKAAITSQGKDLSSRIDPSFGRARWSILMETDSGEYEGIENKKDLNAAQGTGIQAGQNVANRSAEAVITCSIGPNALKTLTAARIKIFLIESCTAQETIERFKSGELREVSWPTLKDMGYES